MEKIFKRVNTEHINAMVKAMRAAPGFKVVKTQFTVLVKTKKGVELFRALKLGRADIWAVSHVKNLFSKEG